MVRLIRSRMACRRRAAGRRRHSGTEQAMRYCKRCVMPDTKPGVTFSAEGVCSACQAVERKASVDWEARANALRALCDGIRGSNGNGYECVVPVSGGKDST